MSTTERTDISDGQEIAQRGLTKRELIAEGEAFEKKHAKRVFIDPLTIKPSESLLPVIIPEIPSKFIEVAKLIVANAKPGDFSELERAIDDAGDPNMGDVLKDLRRAKNMLK